MGNDHTSNSDYISGFHDGQKKPAIGVHNYQIFRANRSYPERSNGLGWTYNHGPNLAYSNKRFNCHYLANPTGEHVAPGATLFTSSTNSMARHPLSICTSDDGIHYDQLLNLRIEVPPIRFWGHEKRQGPQYIRELSG